MKFFHKLANLHGRNNFIGRIKDGDTIIENQEAIQENFVQFYRNLYQDPYTWHPKVDGLPFDMLYRIYTKTPIRGQISHGESSSSA